MITENPRRIPDRAAASPAPGKGGLYRTSRNLALAALLAASCLTFTQGCGSSEVKQDVPQQSSKPLIWPAPPEPARIAYVKTIEKPQDIGATKGFFTKIFEFVMGSKVEEMIKPYGVSVDSTGRIIAVDTPLKRIHIFDPKKREYTYIEEAGDFNVDSPIAAAVDSEDNIYVTDSGAGKVFVYSAKGRFQYAINGIERPTGIAINKTDKALYVSDTGAHDIKVFDLKGKLQKTIGKRGDRDGELNYPVDLFIDRNGDLYVNDSMNFRVQIFDSAGKFVSKFGGHGDGTGDFGRPKGIAVDREGHIYVADAVFDTVQIFDRNGRFLLNFGAIGREPGTFWLPSGLYIDSGDKIYVSDSYNKRIQVFEFLGNG